MGTPCATCPARAVFVVLMSDKYSFREFWLTRFHFISGLPRSGSTLLAGILRQNPRFHAAMNSLVKALLLRGINK